MTKYLFGVSIIVNAIVFTFGSNSSSTQSNIFGGNRFAEIKESNNESLQLSESRYIPKAVNPHHTNGVVFLSRFNKLMSAPFVHSYNYRQNEKPISFSSLIKRNDLPVYRDAPTYYSQREVTQNSFDAIPSPVKHLSKITSEHHPHHDYWDYGYMPGIPGKPWKDYPLFIHIPHTSFSCKQVNFPGYYADVETGCQVWHYCQLDGRHDKFLCPNGTIFNQETRVCDWWYNVHCPSSPNKFDVNSDLYGFRSNYIQITDPFKSNHYGDSIAQEIPAPPPPPPIAPVIEYIIPPQAIAKGQLSARYDSLHNRFEKRGHYSPAFTYRREPHKEVIFAESKPVQNVAKPNKWQPLSRLQAKRKRRKQKQKQIGEPISKRPTH